MENVKENDMANVLQLRIGGKGYEASPVKVDRDKLYGFTEVRATDVSGGPCRSASLDPETSEIIPEGGVKIGMVDADGNWVERSELVAVDAEGNRLEMLPSSFGSPIELSRKVGVDEFLDHDWKSVYWLDNPELARQLGSDIYVFPFNYRADVNPNDGLLLASDGKAFLFVGEKTAFEYVGIETEAVAEPEEGGTEEDLDFSMM